MTRAEIVARYLAEESMGQIAEAAGITQQSVRQHLVAAGVPRRPPGLARKLARQAGRSWQKMRIDTRGLT